MRLERKVAIVTGAARGIGRATAERFAREGAKVVVVDRNRDEGAAAVHAITTLGADCRFLATDVTNATDVENMVQATVEEFGHIDILVNNAGIYPLQTWDEISLDDWHRVIDTNLTSVFLLCRAVRPRMREAGGGSIINVVSTVAFAGSQKFPHYAASKAGLLGLTKAMARSFGDDGIRVNAIAPGLTLTETTATDRPIEDVDAMTHLRAIKRRQVPQDLVGTMVYLASEDSDFVTGQCIVVDGGSYLH